MAYIDITKEGGAYDTILYDGVPGLTQIYWRAQQFRPSQSNISGIIIPVYRLGNPSGSLVIEVQTDNGSNEPSGTVLTSTSMAASSIPASGKEIQIALSPTIITSGAKHWICLKSSAAWDIQNCIYWKYKSGDFTDYISAGIGDFTLSSNGLQFDLVTLYNKGVTPLNVYPNLIIFDPSMNPVARVHRAESFTYTEDWYYPDTWELKIDREKPGADQIELKGFIGWTDDLGVMRIGIIENIEQPRSRGGEQWTISGRGSAELLYRRNCMHLFNDSTYAGYDKVTGIAYETAMRHYVNYNIINATDTSRNVAGISLHATDYLRGTDASGNLCDKQARGETLPDILQDLGLTSTLSYNLVWMGADQAINSKYLWEFQVYAGTYRPNIKLSMTFSNVLSYKYLESILNYANLIYVAGTGDGASRVLYKSFDGTEPTDRDRFESFIEATDCTTTDQLMVRGQEILATKQAEQKLEFAYNPASQSVQLGVDFYLGDIITVVDPDIATIVQRITSVTTTYAGKGKEVTIGMGTRPLDLLMVERMKRKQVGGIRK